MDVSAVLLVLASVMVHFLRTSASSYYDLPTYFPSRFLSRTPQFRPPLQSRGAALFSYQQQASPHSPSTRRASRLNNHVALRGNANNNPIEKRERRITEDDHVTSRSIWNDDEKRSNEEAESTDSDKNGNVYGNQNPITPADTNTLLSLKFASNFTAFDPRNPTSLFLFPAIDETTNLLQDNAAFLYDRKSHLIDMISVPFSRWLPQRFGIAAAFAAYDGAVKLKEAYSVAEGDTLKVTLRFRCRTINTSRSKFPTGAVQKSDDDPRLGACGIDITDGTKTGLEFSIWLTNKGIWAKYSRGSLSRVLQNATWDSFEIYRRVATRDNSDELIDARIEVDNSAAAKQTRYYINDRLVWVVGNWGVLSKDLFYAGNRRNRLVSFSAGSERRRSNNGRAITEIGKFSVYIHNAKKLDEADPNLFEEDADGGQYSPALVRVVDLPDYYDPNVQFFDEKSLRFSSLWGQGVVAGLHSLLVEMENSHQAENRVENHNGSSKSFWDDDLTARRALSQK